jgi:putative DNA primase/helicase
MALLPRAFEGPWRSEEYPAPEDQFKEAMRKSGIEPPDTILMDGKLHRFPTKNGKDDAGYYVLYGDHIPAGGFGDWRTGEYQKFCGRIHRPLTEEEKRQTEWRIFEARKARDEAMKLKHESAAETVELIWTGASPADQDHPYLQRKKIMVNGARITGDGRLVVPLYDQDGDLSSLQYIEPDGGKKYQAGGAVKGCYNIIGDITQNQIIYIAEGFATAATIYEATGCPAVASYSAGNLEPVTGLFRHRFPDAKIIIVADNDESGIGQAHAEQAAAKHRGSIIMPPKDGDVNDYKNGGGDVKALLTTIKSALAHYFADDIPADFIPPDEIVQGMFTSSSVSILYGDSNSGKTFFALAIAGALSEGLDFMGMKTDPGVVIYLATEAPESIKQRIQAMKKHTGLEYKNLAVVHEPVNLHEGSGDALSVVDLIKATSESRGPVRMVIADTLARIAAGANENSGEMQPIMQRFDMIKDQTGAAVLIIHHSGKDTLKGARGWSGIRAHVDTEIEITQSGKIHTAQITKQRNLSSKGSEIHFKLEIIQMGIGKFGDEVSTCVAVHTDEKPETGQEKKDKRIEDRHMERFAAAWIKSNMEYSSNDYPYVTTAAVMRYLVDDEGLREGAARTAAKPSGGKFITQLIKCGKIECFLDGYIATDNDFCQKLEFKRMGENAKK